MKHKKNKPEPKEQSAAIRRKNYLLSRRQAKREKEKQSSEQTKNIYFEQQLENAVQKSAVFTKRTKGYYRFSREYPSKVSPDGFRENSDSKLSGKIKLIACIIVCLAVFCVSFIIAKTGMLLSDRALSSVTSPAVEATPQLNTKALTLDYQALKEGDIAAIDRKLKAYGCDTVILEYKDEEGYIYFPQKSFMGKAGDRRVLSAEKTVQELQALGYTVWAGMSCLKDTNAATADYTYAIRKSSEQGNAWYDTSGSAWLNPWSQNAVDYLNTLVANAVSIGFDGLLLSNLTVPSDRNSSTAYFTGRAEADQTDREVIAEMTRQLVSAADGTPVYLLVDIGSLASLTSSVQTKEGETMPSAIPEGIAGICVDARIGRQTQKVALGEHSLSDVTQMPFVFSLEAGEYLLEQLKSVKTTAPLLTFVCTENGADLSDCTDGVRLSGVNGLIIW